MCVLMKHDGQVMTFEIALWASRRAYVVMLFRSMDVGGW